MRINPDVGYLFAFQLKNYDPWPHIKAEVSV